MVLRWEVRFDHVGDVAVEERVEQACVAADSSEFLEYGVSGVEDREGEDVRRWLRGESCRSLQRAPDIDMSVIMSIWRVE